RVRRWRRFDSQPRPASARSWPLTSNPGPSPTCRTARSIWRVPSGERMRPAKGSALAGAKEEHVVLTKILGLVTPIRMSARLYLVNDLARRQIELPPKCAQELAGSVIHTCKLISRATGTSWRREVTFHLQQGARVMVLAHRGAPARDAVEEVQAAGYAAVMVRHGIAIPNRPPATRH